MKLVIRDGSSDGMFDWGLSVYDAKKENPRYVEAGNGGPYCEVTHEEWADWTAFNSEAGGSTKSYKQWDRFWDEKLRNAFRNRK